MHILIIGSKGFIGTHASKYFGDLGYDVYGCDVVVDYSAKNYFLLDATNADYHSVFRKNTFDICINCSGAASVPDSLTNPLRDYTLNTVNVFKILDAIRQYQPACKFVNLSSAAVYGNPKELPISEYAHLNPISPYGIHKVQAEQICQEFNTYFGISTCSVRIFSAYGEGLQKQLFWDLYQKLKSRNNIELFGTGKETRDFIYISDLLSAIDCVIKNANFCGEAINIANGTEETIAKIAEIFSLLFETPKQITFNNIVKVGDPMNWKADISIITSFGYEQNTDIRQGLKKYKEWAERK